MLPIAGASRAPRLERSEKVRRAPGIRGHGTTSPKVKLDDGSEEEHKVVKDKGAMHNFIKWVLAL